MAVRVMLKILGYFLVEDKEVFYTSEDRGYAPGGATGLMDSEAGRLSQIIIFARVSPAIIWI